MLWAGAWLGVQGATGAVLFSTTFSSCHSPVCSLNSSLFKPVDTGAVGVPSEWIASDVASDGERYRSGAVAAQIRNVYAAAGAADPFAGTYLEYRGDGASDWADYSLSVDVNALFPGPIGVMFRLVDADNAYRFVWRSRSTTEGTSLAPGATPSPGTGSVLTAVRELQKKVHGRWSTVARASGAPAFPFGSFVNIRAECRGSSLRIYVNGERIISAEDGSLRRGTWALFNSRNPGVRYANIEVRRATADSATHSPLPPPTTGAASSAAPSATATAGPLATVLPLPSFQGAGSERVVFTMHFTDIELHQFTADANSAVTRALLDGANTRQLLLSQPPLALIGLRSGSVRAEYAGVVNAAQLQAFQNRLNRYVCGGSLASSTRLGAVECNRNATLPTVIEPSPTSSSGSGNAGATAGVAVGVTLGVLALIAVIALGWWIRRHRRRRRLQHAKGGAVDAAVAPALDGDLAEQGLVFRDGQVFLQGDTAGKTLNGDGGLLKLPPPPPPLPADQNNFVLKADDEPEADEGFSILATTRRLTLDKLLEYARPQANGWRVLVVDSRTLRILSAVARHSELVGRGVTLVEALEETCSAAHSLPLSTIYFLSPVERSFAHLIQVAAQRDPQCAQRVYLTRTLDGTDGRHDTLVQRLALDRAGFPPLQVDYVAVEQRLISLESRPGHMLPLLYGSAAAPPQLTQTLGQEIGTVFHALGCGIDTDELPWIQVHTSSAANEPAIQVARAAQAYASQQLLPRVPKFTSTYAGSGGSAVHAILVDRAIDPFTPLMHLRSYRACLAEASTELASGVAWPPPNDRLWRRLRDVDLVDAAEALSNELDALLHTDTVGKLLARSTAKNGRICTDNLSLRELGELARGTPDLFERIRQLEWHISAVNQCLREYDRRHLPELLPLEDELVSGRRASDGRRVRTASLKRRVESVLRADRFQPHDQMRLLLLYAAARDPTGWSALLDAAPVFTEEMRTYVRAAARGLLDRMNAAKLACKAARARRRRRAKSARRRARSRDAMAFEPILRHIFLQYIEADRRTGERVWNHPSVLGERDAPSDVDDDDDTDNEVDSPMEVGVAAGALDSPQGPAAGARAADSPRPARSQRKRERSRSVSAGRSQSVAHTARPAAAAAFASDEKFLLLVLGGVCAAEVQLAYALAQQCHLQVVIGGTSLLTPRQFMDELVQLGKETGP